MKCDDVQALLIDAPEAGDPSARRAAIEHLAYCTSCRDAQVAAGVLRVERARPVPGPTPGAFERAIAHATRGRGDAGALRTPSRAAGRGAHRGFWAGMAVGAVSAAAAAAAWVVLLVPAREPQSASTTPLVTMALNEKRDVSIAVDTPAPLRNAEIRVVLTGAISLDGFADRRELRWHADLEAGSNQLTLPVVATGAAGQLMVEVQHGQKRRTFIVDIRGVEA
ncbi:MAG TPA: hypothetical protein VF329_06565 [Gammaproteobacteria bacterium]